MCLGRSRSPAPPPPPAPAPPAPVPVLNTVKDEAKQDDAMGRTRGRRKLRVDLAATPNTGTEGSGLNIPTT